jgi:transcriptional regulator with XRE-family HTH domain
MEALAAYLKANNLTQRWLARRLGVREATVSGWMSGVMPRPHHMQAIAITTDHAVPVTAWFEQQVAAE